MKEIEDLEKQTTHKYSYGSDKAWEKAVDKIVNRFKDRLNVENRKAIYVMDIHERVVDRKVAKHCIYAGDKYIGKIYLDKEGNIFDSIADAKAVCGDNAVFCTPPAQGEYSSTSYAAESVYIPEADCILLGIKSFSNYARVSSINENNDHLNELHCSDVRYVLITKNLMCIERNRAPIHVSWFYVDGQLKIDGMMNAIKQLLELDVGVVNVGGNKYVPLDRMAHIVEFSKYKAKLAHKSGKVQNKIDELVAMKEFDSTPMKNRMPHEYENLVCKTYINKISDNTSVIRWAYSYRDEGFDGMRVYIDGHDVYACKRNNQGQFVKVALSTLNQKNFTSEYSAEVVLDDMTGTRLEWYQSVINTIPEKHRMTLLITFLSDTRIEQLVKLGMCGAICNLLETKAINIGAAIRNTLRTNPAEEDNKNIYRWMGVNKYQFGEMLKVCSNSERHGTSDAIFHVIADMKDLFDERDISHFDNALFDEMKSAYAMFLNNTGNSWYNVAPFFFGDMLRKAKRVDDTGVFANNMLHYLPKIITMSNWRRDVAGQYSDYINMVCSMNIRQRVRLYPADAAELKEMHDNVATVYNMNKVKFQRDAFIARAEKLQSFEYENEDFNFCVKAPEKPEDLVVEGVELHHCVKSYIDRVCRGQTNVLFIRKKDDVTKPFFTVEVTNDRVIAQVHGFANRNADTEPDMIEFVQRWARNKRLKVGSINRRLA